MIVLANGCFDPLHIGHVYHLQAASEWGMLYVSVTDDEHVNKGPGRPVFPIRERLHMVRALECVHGVIAVSSTIEALKEIKPDILVKGAEYKHRIGKEIGRYCIDHGIAIRFTDTKKYSSTELLRHYERLST